MEFGFVALVESVNLHLKFCAAGYDEQSRPFPPYLLNLASAR
jgi:hypothetical protein